MSTTPTAFLDRKPAKSSALGLLFDLGPKLLLGIAVALPLEMAIRDGFLLALGNSPVLAFFMIGSFAIHMWTRPGWRELGGVIGAGLALALCFTAFVMRSGQSMVVMCGSFAGVGSLAVLAGRGMLGSEEERREKFSTLAAAGVLPTLWIITAYSVKLTTSLYPSTYDLYLFAFDGSLGFHPSFLAGQLFLYCPPIQFASALVYLALPLGVSMLYGWHRVNTHRLPVNVLMLFLATSILGFQMYYFVPATGPLYAFPNAFPWNPPDLRMLSLHPLGLPPAPRNAMPSLHAAAALLVFWNSLVWPRWARVLCGVFLFLTLLATLGLGEHYFVDLVVAVPLSLALQAGFSASLPWRAPERWNAVLLGGSLVGLWFVFLRMGAPLYRVSPAIGWIAVAGTLAPCILALRRLRRTYSAA